MVTDAYAELERELSRLFRRAHSASHELSSTLHPDLDAELYSLLAYIDRNPGSLAKHIVAEFRLDPATVSRQLGRAESAGLISRETDPKDSRGQTITLTPEGQREFETARESRSGLLRRILGDWPVDDVDTLGLLLSRLLVAAPWVRDEDAGERQY